MLSKQFKNLDDVALHHAQSYKSALPFPHIVLHDVFNSHFLNEILDDFPDLSKKDTVSHNNAKEKKFGSRGERYFGDKTKLFMNYLNSEPFLRFLQLLTGIEEPLIPDPYFSGGGQHEIKPGGLLKIHADFNKHPKLKLDRRINVLIYLNKNWEESYGGHFELWNKDMTKCEKRILPTFNTIAIFSTTDYSYHGHPDPLTCPEDMSRKSLALYYFSNGRPSHEINSKLKEHSTLFKERIGNKADKRAFSSLTSQKIKELLIDFVPPILIKVKNKIFDRK